MNKPNGHTPYAAQDDESLARLAAQDADAFAELYRRHLNRVYRYLLAKVGSVADAQDLTAQTFIAALEGIASYAGRGRFAAWLLSIARHKALSHFRQRQAVLPLELAEALPHPAPLPEETVFRRLTLAQVTAALDTLTPDRAEALVLRIFGDLSAAEAGHVMGKSPAAVRMLVHRAIHDLQTLLTAEPSLEDER